MKRLEADIQKASETEIVLSDVGNAIWIPRFIALFTGLASCMALTTVETIPMVCWTLPMTVLCWQLLSRVTIVQFNQPKGYLTVKTSPWWTIFIPAGPNLIKVPIQVPLPKTSPFVEDHSGLMTYPVQTGPDTVEIRQSYVNRFQIQLPMGDGKVFTLWTTSDRNTYIEIIRRINKAIQDCSVGLSLRGGVEG